MCLHPLHHGEVGLPQYCPEEKGGSLETPGEDQSVHDVAGLMERVLVENMMEVVVEDTEEQDRKSHSDQAIEECLRDLNVETWNWKMNISSSARYSGSILVPAMGGRSL